MFPSLVSDFIRSLRYTQSCPDVDVHAKEIHLRRHSADEASPKTNDGVASWDYKRHKCSNCKHIYLKSLSPAVGFCSMDCKANAMYLHAMSEKIKAAKDCVQAEQVVEPSMAHQAPESKHERPDSANPADDRDESDMDFDLAMGTYCPPATFAEFHTRKLTCRPVEWSFSAMY
ncbi:hypothetical protein DYB32_003499 [Aphanomyces invadans]|uniref:Uncharacterized protein n=1 Tax=Aphanomyces invadans TaxID=157072 RepID=A0A418B0D8_9STRA|nr:hypothetical protein DYB32_003499 [Aphanomyces invadans]